MSDLEFPTFISLVTQLEAIDSHVRSKDFKLPAEEMSRIAELRGSIAEILMYYVASGSSHPTVERLMEENPQLIGIRDQYKQNNS